MRTPKAPAGFVPVDSEEAKKILDDYAVNTACVSSASGWYYNCFSMKYVRDRAKEHPDLHYHVQLPPPVEWEEVFTWRFDGSATWLHERMDDGSTHVMRMPNIGKKKMDTIVRALNEREGRDG